jgi:two-component system, cell cycle sensor histidine kinase and response regulator CckA
MPQISVDVAARAAASGQITVLLADDEPQVRNLTRLVLQQAGFQVDLAEDGQEAVELFQSNPTRYQLVVLDLMMPRLSGDEAFERILAIDPEAAVVITSGCSAGLIRSDFGKRLRGFVPKPFQPEELLHALRQALDGPSASATA